MHKVDYTHINYSEKVQLIKSIFNGYEQAKLHLEDLSFTYRSPLMVKENTPSYYNYEQHLLHHLSKTNRHQAYVDYIDHKLMYLSESERRIIDHDFIKKTSKKWWESYYSSATYYRHKKRAIEKLIELLFS